MPATADRTQRVDVVAIGVPKLYHMMLHNQTSTRDSAPPVMGGDQNDDSARLGLMPASRAPIYSCSQSHTKSTSSVYFQSISDSQFRDDVPWP